MLAPSTDRAPSAGATESFPFQGSEPDLDQAERRPTWWLDESEHARLLGVKLGTAKPAGAAAKPKTSPKPQSGSPHPAPASNLDPAFADFATLTPTLAALDRILRPPASDAPGLAPRHRSDRIRRLGVAFGAAAVMAAVVFFR